MNHRKYSKRLRKSKLRIIKEHVDSGDETDILLSDSEASKKPAEKDNQNESDPEIPRLKRENGFYGVMPTAKL